MCATVVQPASHDRQDVKDMLMLVLTVCFHSTVLTFSHGLVPTALLYCNTVIRCFNLGHSLASAVCVHNTVEPVGVQRPQAYNYYCAIERLLMLFLCLDRQSTRGQTM